MKIRSFLFAWPVALLGLVFALLGCSQDFVRAPAVSDSHADIKAPDSVDADAAANTKPNGTGDAILYDFQAEWCGPCKRMDPLVQSLINRGYPIKQVDVDQNRSLAARYGVNGIPCFVLVVDGQEVDRVVGMVPLSRLERMFTKNNVGPVP